MSPPRPPPGNIVLRAVVALFFVALAVGSIYAQQTGLTARLQERVQDRLQGRAPRLSAGDFPAGVMAPVEDLVKVPLRPLVVGLVPRGAVAPLLLAAGDAERVGLFRAAYAIDVKVERYQREEDVKKALVRGGENGGVDVAALPVSSLAMSASLLRDSAPRVLMLVGRSRGQEVLAARPPHTLVSQLLKHRVAAEPRSAGWYLLLWSLSRAGLTLRDVELVPLDSASTAVISRASRLL